ncbi:MAG: hypothetical protein C3F02_03535 [Parcubacteria group bacterium]|nr:MAG: hypothetical protein C3F02_03535 [Parcubacteria group bacterium]
MKSLKSSLQERIVFLRLRSGDADAFVFFYDKYVKSIYRYVLIKVSAKEVAEDLTQDIFLKTWQHLVDKKQIANFQSFVFRIARNTVIDYYRQNNRQELPLEFLPEELEQAPADHSHSFHRSLDLEKLLQDLRKLKPEYQEVIYLRYVEDLSIDDIAQIVDMQKSAVRVLLHRALSKLREITKL